MVRKSRSLPVHQLFPPYFLPRPSSEVVKLHSPLFIRLLAAKHQLAVTPKGVRKRAQERFEGRSVDSGMAAVAAAQSNTAAPQVPPDPGLGARSQEPWKENLNMHLICRECKEFPPNLVEEFSSGDTVCGSCGLVLGDRIVDTRSEWRTFSNDDQAGDDPSRVGDAANPLLNGSQLQTSISYGGGNGGRNRDLQRAQSKATHDKGTKALLAAYKEIDAFAESMQVPKVVADSTKGMYKEVHDANAFRGKSQETLIAGMLFIACRQHKVPRTFREVFALTKVSKGRLLHLLDSTEHCSFGSSHCYLVLQYMYNRV